MVSKLGITTTVFRVLQFIWALIYTIEIGKHALSNSEYGGALDYQPVKTLAGLAIAFLLITVGLHAFGILGSFTGLRQSPMMRKIRIAVEGFDLFLWFMNLWIVFYLPKIADIDVDPENDAINDTLYWSNPWTVPTLMMNIVLFGLVIAEARHENKATGHSGVYNVPLEDAKADTQTTPVHDTV